MNKYEENWKIRSTDVDLYRRLKLSALFVKLQETAVAHTEALGVGPDKTLDRGLLWVVAQQRARIHRIPRYDETLRLCTWPGKTMHLFFPRHWLITDPEGKPLVEASAVWALMDQSTRKIAFPENYGIQIEGDDGQDSRILPKRIKAEQVSGEASFSVPFSYVDLNGHMNNTRYFDLAMDYLPDEFRAKEVRELSTEYIGEAPYKKTLTLRYGILSENIFYISGEHERHSIFRMKLSFE